jgi:hypothetical protein
MRFLVLLCLATVMGFAAEPTHSLDAIRPMLDGALKTFRTEGPKGWSFTQTTHAEGRSRVERYDAAQPEFNRWTLLQQDDRPPTAEELQDYREKQSRRSRGGTAPQLTDQLDLATLTLVDDTPKLATFRARLKTEESGDATGKFMVATIVLHKPSSTITSFQLKSDAPFSPTLGVKIEAMETTLTYSLPDDARPSLLLSSETHLRGRAFFFKSLDADMSVTFTDYESVRRR